MVPARTRLRALLPVCLLIGLAACSEPKDPFDAFMELQTHETKIERDIFTLANERLQTIETTCFRLYGVDGKAPNPAKLSSCIDEVVKGLSKANENASTFTTESLQWATRVFDNFKDEWLSATNKQRAELKMKLIETLKEGAKAATDKTPKTDKNKSISTRVMKSATNELIRENLIPPGTTADLVATGRLLDPVAPGVIRVSFAAGAPNHVTINDPVLGSQSLQFSGDATLTARVDPGAPGTLQLVVSSLALIGSNLDFDAVSTGTNQIALNPTEPSAGQMNLTTGQATLSVALTVTNDFLPAAVLFMNVSASGALRTVGADTLLDLAASGPAIAAFPSQAPAPPTEIAANVDALGGTVTLREDTTIIIPAGALGVATTIELFMTAAILAPTSVPTGFTRVAVTRELFPRAQIFSVPVTVTIPYNEGDIAGLDPSTLRAILFDPSTETWTLIPDSSVDISQSLVTLRVSSFGSGYVGIAGRSISGDLDADGDVDQNDLAILLPALNTPANGPTDPRDLNKDGRIDIVDARLLTTLCTRPNCSVQ